jgi:hypothetical protein
MPCALSAKNKPDSRERRPGAVLHGGFSRLMLGVAKIGNGFIR